MLDHLNELVTSIVIVIILASFLELLLPPGNLQRYVRLVIGLMIVLIILNPIVKILENGDMIEPDIFEEPEADIDQVDDLLERGEDMQQNRIDKIDARYKDEIKGQVKERSQYHFDSIEVANVEIEYQDDSSLENYGEIKSLTVFLDKKDKELDEQNKEELVEPVEEIKISLENDNTSDLIEKKNNKSENKLNVSDEKLDNFEKDISDVFQITEDHVLVKVMK
ncbi:stage III sporulation protein AF [Natranaerobius trueperi]|uniref:Stage III sporulation protein AF n=1 Tax=Natranaerobius trueperi TaxID=759412 RepID=A0A226BYE5_9FIRM|nr:stage III sporulation protein AF [Natranaerobius trueperi]OWZ84026.1 stage III sporulation protein AF [Natranaerobius trueperi]